MLEAYIQRVETDDPGGEEPALTRDRLKPAFPPGSTRRMTTLGLLVGAAVTRLGPGDGPIVYASGYSESRALEGFLDSFPTPSPTLFQTSIHPSAVQQLMISRQLPLRTLLPISGGALLAFHALRAGLLSPADATVLCGGEEKGTWLLQYGLASPRTFAFAAVLGRERAGAAARVALSRGGEGGSLPLADLFDLLHRRTPFDGAVAPGWRLNLEWL